jgi:PncC family amidohydrolase
VSLETRLGKLLAEQGLKIAVAESCTGGLIAKRITDIPGSSEYFEAGLVTYSNAAKEKFLGVSGDLLIAKGAVSREVAGEMAEGVRAANGVDIGLSVTGVAGPGGGTVEKPVGTVFMGLSVATVRRVREHHFSGDRKLIRSQTADAALTFILDYFEGRVA